jgi:hypothetical protein
MSTSAAENAPRVVTPGIPLTTEEAAAILEIAHLAVAADRRLTDDELLALRGIAGRVRSIAAKHFDANAVLGDRELFEMIEGYGERTREEADARLRELGRSLGPSARTLAYRVAYALSMCDLDAADEEFEFDLQLIDALELTTDQVGLLQAEVNAAIAG